MCCIYSLGLEQLILSSQESHSFLNYDFIRIFDHLAGRCLHRHLISELMTLVVLGEVFKLQQLNCGSYCNFAMFFPTLPTFRGTTYNNLH
jgi:hypothetical protein